jgi:hypothetical protein
MVKIFPTRFYVESADTTADQVWQWVNEKIKNSKVSKIIPLNMEYSASKTTHVLKGLLEVHCTENITTSEFSNILKPHPSFIQQIHFTFQ